MTAHRAWRIDLTFAPPSGAWTFGDVAMAESSGGSNVASIPSISTVCSNNQAAGAGGAPFASQNFGSTNTTGANGAYKAFDGLGTGIWSGSNNTTPQILGYVFTSATTVTHIGLVPRNDGGSGFPTQFDIQYSDDTTTGSDGTWTTARSIDTHLSTRAAITDGWASFPTTEATAHKGWRIHMTGNSGTPGAFALSQMVLANGGQNLIWTDAGSFSSGLYTGTFGMFRAFDGGSANYWSATGSTPTKRFVVVFGTNRDIKEIKITSPSAGGTGVPLKWSLSWSDDTLDGSDGTWTTAATIDDSGTGTFGTSVTRTYNVSSASTETGTAAMAFAGIAFVASATVTHRATATMAFSGIAFSAAGARTETGSGQMAFAGIAFTAVGHVTRVHGTASMAFAGITIHAAGSRLTPPGTGLRQFWTFGA